MMNWRALPRAGVVAAALLILVPPFLPGWILFVLTKAMFMFVAVMGVSVLLRGGLLTFGHALYYATGAYAVGFCIKWLGVRELLFLVPLGALAGFIMAALVGIVMARYREVFFAMLNLAFSMMLFGALLKLYWITGGTDGLVDLLGLGDVVAVGECGLDYHYDHSPRPEQRRVFAAQIGLAHETGLTLVVHSRSAWDDTFAILASEGVPERTILHCFTGGVPEAERALEAGAYLSFSGIVSFPKAREVHEAAEHCPADRLLVETDAPLLAPVPLRGRPNSPANVPLVGAALAAVRGSTPQEVAAITTANARRVFGLESLESA